MVGVGGGGGRACWGGRGTNHRKISLDQPSPSVLGREERGSVEKGGSLHLLPSSKKTCKSKNRSTISFGYVTDPLRNQDRLQMYYNMH